MGDLIGYGRVSTTEQNPALQLDALHAARCERVFCEEASGAVAERPELARALDHLRAGDTLVVWKLDRLGRSLRHLINTIRALEERGDWWRYTWPLHKERHGGPRLLSPYRTGHNRFALDENFSYFTSLADDCSSISTKINYLRHTIRRHQEWDQTNPDRRWPGGRHAAEIADLQRALANCIAIASTKCRGQPIYVPVPESQESREERAERVRRQLYEALPWAVAVLVVGLVVACVIAEPCGAAVLAAVAAIAGEEAVAIVMAILVANGVLTEG